MNEFTWHKKKLKVRVSMKKFGSLLVVMCWLAVIPFTGVAVSGCSSGKTTTVTTNEVRSDHDHNTYAADHTGDPSHTVTKTETETVTEDEGGNGIFGIIGDIIALPFRAVAAIL